MQQPRASSLSTLRVVAIPAIPAFVSLGVTLLRLVGELRDWPKPLVNNDVCGKAILGVAWLVPIFGDLLRGQALSCGPCAPTVRPPHAPGGFGIGP